jgi:hypothetical protein
LTSSEMLGPRLRQLSKSGRGFPLQSSPCEILINKWRKPSWQLGKMLSG